MTDDEVLSGTNDYGELRYEDTPSAKELGWDIYNAIPKSIKIKETDEEFAEHMQLAKARDNAEDDILGCYLMRTVSLALQMKCFAGYRGKLAEDMRDEAMKCAVVSYRYYDPAKATKGRKPCYSFVLTCVIRKMKGVLSTYKKKLLNKIKAEERHGGLANPELYITLGAYSKNNYFDGRVAVADEEDYRRSIDEAHEQYQKLMRANRSAERKALIRKSYRDAALHVEDTQGNSIDVDLKGLVQDTPTEF